MSRCAASKEDLPCKWSCDKQQQLSDKSQTLRKTSPTDGDGRRRREEEADDVWTAGQSTRPLAFICYVIWFI